MATPEADLCAAFTTYVGAAGLVAYPEVSGWDLVLVRSGAAPTDLFTGRLAPGDQVGVHAKVVGGVAVLAQIVEAMAEAKAPRFGVALVERSDPDFLRVSKCCGIPVFYRSRRAYRSKKWVEGDSFYFSNAEPRPRGGDQLWLPPVVPDLPAGVRSPQQLTEWRVGALKLCAVLRARGYLLPSDFQKVGVDRRRWVRQWVRPLTSCSGCSNTGEVRKGTCPECDGHPRRYTRMPGAELPDAGWEAVTDQLRRAGQLVL